MLLLSVGGTGMKIIEFIVNNEIAMAEERIVELKRIKAPSIMISGLEKNLAELRSGKIKVNGDYSLLEEEYIGHEVKTGRGGRPFIVFGESIMYFPMARYGRYVKLDED
jgi:hypothetical protein